MKSHPLSRVIVPLVLLAVSLPALADPQWIWLSKDAKPNEKVTLRREFTLDGVVKSASLSVSVDNGAKAFINGKQALENPDWSSPTTADVKGLLEVGENQIRLDATNKDAAAAAVAILTIELSDGKKVVVETGKDWKAAPTGSSEFKPAVTVAKYGDGPWGAVFAQGFVAKKGRASAPQTATDPDAINVLPGFKVEKLYTVPKPVQGSWVSMTVDKKGRLICGDQGGGLYRLTPPPIGSSEQSVVEPLDAGIGGAHGLLYAHDSLYAMLNEGNKQGLAKGLYRLKDTDGDDHFEAPVLISACNGGGEHGPHSIQLAPDGKNLFFNAGNHTKLPSNLATSRAAKDQWDEDHILPRLWDGNGHARGILAPGGYICKTDPEGKMVELFCAGFRNEFDFAFDMNGELFAYDADMEWDIGSPWYRPTRINHCVSGGDYGWRSGAGKWPTFYPDSLPASVDIGPGSPTGVTFGTGAKFPAKYQRALFGNDWTYGTMYAVHFTPDGAGFKAVKEEFVSGRPLPLTDVVISRHDGAMYFAVGGRGAQSAVYRVTYTGKDSTAPAEAYALTEQMKQRRALERLHEDGTGPEAIEKAWASLASKDRFLRYAARVAIERQPAKLWAARALKEKDPQALIEAMVALARVGRTAETNPQAAGKSTAGTSSGPVGPTAPEDAKLQEQILVALDTLEFAKLDLDKQFQLLRAYQLAFTRLGKPDAAACAKAAAHLDPLYPQANPLVNRELCQLLVFLDSKSAVAKTLGLVAAAVDDASLIATDELLARNPNYANAVNSTHASRPNLQQIALMAALRNARASWTPELKKTFFSWFPRTRVWHGGNSFPKFIENIRAEAMVNFVTDPEERTALNELSKKAPLAPPANVVMPKGPGKAYSVDDVVALAKDGLRGRDFAQGKAMFTATLCAQCHRFNGEGGSIGPDLTGAGNRYSIRDLTENITDPSKVISDQYGTDQIEMKDGSTVVGRPIVEENGKLFVMANPFSPDELTAVTSADIKSRKPFNVSMMPPGLINALNQDELLDLIAFIMSGANPNDKAFKK